MAFLLAFRGSFGSSKIFSQSASMEQSNEEKTNLDSPAGKGSCNQTENQILDKQNADNRSENGVSNGDFGMENRKKDANGNGIILSNGVIPGVDSAFDEETDKKPGNANGISSETDAFGRFPVVNLENNGREHEPIKSSSEKVAGTTQTTSATQTLGENLSEIEAEKREIQVEEQEGERTSISSIDKLTDIQISSPQNHESDMNINEVDHTQVQLLRPHSQLPQPEAPSGIMKSTSFIEDSHPMERSVSVTDNFSSDVPAIGKYIRDRSNSFSAAIYKRISSLKESDDKSNNNDLSTVTEINLSGLKVIVQLKEEEIEIKDLGLKGRISFFSRSNCRDCSAVRLFFRERGLKFVEINIDVYPCREKELIEKTGKSSLPQIFFNEKLLGGLVVLNSLRNSGEFERRLKEMLGKRCPENAPSPPVYGFDDQEEEVMDEMIGIVRVLRQRLPIQDRITKMKIVKNCFAGSEMVEVMIQHLDCGRKKAVEIGRELARKHFIHHVFGENDFEDGSHLYRFLEHESFIPKCFNFRGSTNDCDPKPAATVSQRLTKIMSAILESYASEDKRHVDYIGISNSEEFRRYVNLAQDLQRVNILALSNDEKLAFFLNLYNAMVIHAVIRIGRPEGMADRRAFFSDFQYLVGGYPYSLNTIKNGVLRSNRRPPYSWIRPFGASDQRLLAVLPKVNPLVHFGLCNATRSCPVVRFFSAQGIEAELRNATRVFFLKDGMQVDLGTRTIYLTRILKWYDVDFGTEKEILKWIINYLESTNAGLLMHLTGDGGPVHIVYQNYDWSINS